VLLSSRLPLCSFFHSILQFALHASLAKPKTFTRLEHIVAPHHSRTPARPPQTHGYGFPHVNVAAQRRDPNSLLGHPRAKNSSAPFMIWPRSSIGTAVSSSMHSYARDCFVLPPTPGPTHKAPVSRRGSFGISRFPPKLSFSKRTRSCTSSPI